MREGFTFNKFFLDFPGKRKLNHRIVYSMDNSSDNKISLREKNDNLLTLPKIKIKIDKKQKV